MNLIGQNAPEWKATAYVNGESKEISNKDYAGKWYVLYWYPLDFTFVCPTEIRGFEALKKDFEAEGIGIVGASTDSFFSHQAWFQDKTTFPNGVTHPVIADTTHAVTKAFDVFKDDLGVGYRATVIVDDKGVIRSVAINDTEVGRSPAETLRTVQAFQSGGLCGADWQKGDKFVA
jgi:peroxiredoxin (alkyl hydroperoxide reductase subunit C)